MEVDSRCFCIWDSQAKFVELHAAIGRHSDDATTAQLLRELGVSAETLRVTQQAASPAHPTERFSGPEPPEGYGMSQLIPVQTRRIVPIRSFQLSRTLIDSGDLRTRAS